MPDSSRARSRSFPAGPTKGLPARSSWSPGCSPTKTSLALRGPRPKTVWVPHFQSGQALHCAAALAREESVGCFGMRVAASVNGRDGDEVFIVALVLLWHGRPDIVPGRRQDRPPHGAARYNLKCG